VLADQRFGSLSALDELLRRSRATSGRASALRVCRRGRARQAEVEPAGEVFYRVPTERTILL
jgi:hypothetical protein